MPAAGRPRLSHVRPCAATCPHHIFRCNKSITYFGNPLLRESISFFVLLKIFHLVYSQCFTMYRHNVALNWNILLQQITHILWKLYIKGIRFIFCSIKNVCFFIHNGSLYMDQILQWIETSFHYSLKHSFHIKWNSVRWNIFDLLSETILIYLVQQCTTFKNISIIS